jgi:3-oxoacyl-[acyl-carrier protein] reductase
MQDLFRLVGKVCVVTGASRGIGRVAAGMLAALGARVVLVGRHAPALEALAGELADQYGKDCAIAVACDVSDSGAVSELFQTVFKRHKRVDALVAAAGIMEDTVIGMVTPELLERVFRTNVFGLMYCSQYASRLMARGGGGSIVAFGSIVGNEGHGGQSVYAGSKAALTGVVRSLAKELAPQQIRVNAVAPGFIETDMTDALDERRRADAIAAIGMGRPGQPDDVAGTVAYLCSDLSRYVTGQVIGVDGAMRL